MGRSVAFLRAINVGGHTVKMAELRRLFGDLGFTGVETFIASGNVVFDAVDAPRAEVEARIAGGLEAALGYAVPAYVRSTTEVAQVAAFDGFGRFDDQSPGALNVGFLAEPLAADAVAAFRTAIDDFRVVGREVYWRCQKKQSESKFSAAVFERGTGVQVTFRGFRTVVRLATKYPPR